MVVDPQNTSASLLHELVGHAAAQWPRATALVHRDSSLDYATLDVRIKAVARGLSALLDSGERVAVYLPKQMESVLAMFGASAAGAVFVPINPLLKPAQVGYLLRHCNVRMLITSPDRAATLAEELSHCHDLRHVVLVGGKPGSSVGNELSWEELQTGAGEPHRRIDSDVAAILYTSGSSGPPKGVIVSHRNLVAGAHSVAEYLAHTPDDRLLAVLPLSFDYGLSQLTSAFVAGASVVLMDYLLPRDVLLAIARYGVTGLAAVPPLWNQLAALDWPDEARRLRYLTNSGGAMPPATTRALRERLPDTDIYLMYGLTEAFRSTYLEPEQVAVRPDSIGKAIPNAEIMVVREDGSECAPGEPGELVHRGVLVALGYWNDPARTAERFRPAPGQPPGVPNPEIAVWSGDRVRRDADGYLYFVARQDDMIKTSGYRVSPTEVEDVVYASGLVTEAVAFGVPDAMLGQRIVVVAQAMDDKVDEEELLAHCRRELPAYMVPARALLRDALPCNDNGKIDRKALSAEYRGLFEEA